MALTKIPGNLIETGAVTGDVLADGGIATAKLADAAVTTDKVLDANITHAKLHATMDLTGKTVTVATASGSTNTTAAASTAFVQQELTTLIGGAPGTLDTLNELAAAINDDDDYHTTLTTALATKLPLAGGTMTGPVVLNELTVNPTNNLVIFNEASTNTDLQTVVRVGSAGGGLYITSDNAGVSKGAYYDAGWIATSTSGNSTDYGAGTSGDINVKMFSGATIGGTPSWNTSIVMKSTGIYVPGNVGIGTANPLNKFVVAHESHGVAIDYVGATLPYQAGLFTSSSALTQTAYGDLNIKSRSDYTTYGIGFFTANVANTPTLRMKISNTGKVGIGTDNPDNTLHVHKGSAGTVVGNTNAPLTVENSANNYIQLLAPNANESGVLFGNPSHSANGGIVYSGANNALELRTNGNVTKMWILGNGKVGIGTDNPPAEGLTIRREGSGKQTLLQLDRPNTAGLQTNIKFSVADIMVGQIQHEYASSNYNHMSFTLRSVGGADIIPLWLENSGNVGIGTTNPLVKLDVRGSPSAPATSGTAQTGSIRASQTQGDGVLDMGFYTSATGTAWIQSTNKSNLATNYGLTLQPNGGNVGIGTTSPAYALDVRDGIVFAGKEVSDVGSISYTNTAAVLSSRGVTHRGNARSNVLRLMRDGTSAVSFAGLADFDLDQWETSGVASRTSMTLKLGHGNLPDTRDVMAWRSDGVVTMPYQPYANASSSSGTAATAGIPLNQNGRSRGGLTISGNRMTVPVAGAYVIGYQHLGNSGSGPFQMAIRVNNTEIPGSRMQDTNSSK